MFKLPHARGRPWGPSARELLRCTRVALPLQQSRSPFCPFWPPHDSIFSILGRPAGDQKIFEFSRPSKIGPRSQKVDRMAPQGRFFIDFDDFSNSFFIDFSDFLPKQRDFKNHRFSLGKTMFFKVSTSQNHQFFNDFSIEFSIFFWTPSPNDFFAIFCRLLGPKCDFGPPVAANWGPTSTRGATILAKKSTFQFAALRAKPSWDRPGAPKSFKMLPQRPKGSIFIDFEACLLYTSPSPRDLSTSRMPSSA